MKRNLISNRQLRAFNALLLDRLGDENCYISARQIIGRDTATEWVELDLADGAEYAFSYAEDKPWFHRCAVMPIYCGVKGSLQGSRDFRDEMLHLIRDWGYEAAVGEPPSMHLLRIDVKFPFPRWHEKDHDDDLLDDSEIQLFPELDDMAEPYTLGMADNSWFNESADTFFQESMVEMRQKETIYGLHELHDPNGRWERSLPNAHEGRTGCIISHYDSKSSLYAQSDFLPIGTFSKVTGTFMWSWHNQGWLNSYDLTESLRANNPELFRILNSVRSISEKYGFTEFAEKVLSVEEFESWEFVAMACKELRADAPFMLPGEDGNTYGVIFYRDNLEKSFTQQTVNCLSKWRLAMQGFLHANKSLYEASSLVFAKEFLKSESGSALEAEFIAAISNESFRDILRLRASELKIEERRFKEVVKALMVKSGIDCQVPLKYL